MSDLMREAAQARAAAATMPADRPRQRRCAEVGDAPRGVLGTILALDVRKAGDEPVDAGDVVFGTASVVEQGYDMYDMYGPYTEVVSRTAFDATLASDPLVEFTLNHNHGGGLPMAHTRNGTLTLSTGDDGLGYAAKVDPTRSDVADMLKAVTRGDLAEASFKFRIVRGQWSPDYSEYRIEEVDLNRGDVSAVNFGANPAATTAVRSAAPALEPATKPRVHVPDYEVAPRAI